MDKKSRGRGADAHAHADKRALTRHLEGKSTLSPHQVRNLRKIISASKQSRKSHKVEEGNSSGKHQVSAEDLSKLKEITEMTSELIKKASDILNHYK